MIRTYLCAHPEPYVSFAVGGRGGRIPIQSCKNEVHDVVLDGSGYEAGKQLAEVINQDPSVKRFHSSAQLDLKKLGFADKNASVPERICGDALR